MGEKARAAGSIVLDTHALIKFFKEEIGAEDVQVIINKIEKGEIKGAISTITSSELFYILARYKDIKFAEIILRYIKLSKIKLIEISEEIAELGGKFKYKYSSGGLPLADALIAATAIVQKSIVVSDEPHFSKIKEITVRAPANLI